VQQRHVGPPVAQQPLLLADPAQQHVDGDRAGLGAVRVEKFRQQLAGRAGLRDQDQAGVAGRGQRGATGTPTGGVDPATVRTAVETNVIGVIRVTNAMLPLLRRSTSPRIVNMSSSVGSLTRQTAAGAGQATGPISAAYSPSKTFLNAVTIQYAKELRDTNILINAACPGFTATDLNGFRGVRTPEQGAAIAIRLANLPDDGPTGGFFEDAGVVPW
jgi:NAD(P)-dependent dehydrogenase (short-subunit alcohol dehydrogenase family)